MPVPVISEIQSVIGFLQWQAFGFQPVATNSPTSWTCSPIAPGLFFEPTTGLISGAAILPGVYSFEMTATNADGTSAPQQFVMGIEVSGFIFPSNVIDLVIEVTSKRVFLAGIGVDAGNAGTASNLGVLTADAEKLLPLFLVKYGDDLMMNIRFTKGGVTYSPSLTSLKFALKELEPESILVSSTAWKQLGTGGESTSFLVYCKVESSKLKGALTNYEDDEATQFPALGEFEWVENNQLSDPIIGPATLRSSSRTFAVMIPRDIIANA